MIDYNDNGFVYWYYTLNPKPAKNGQDETIGNVKSCIEIYCCEYYEFVEPLTNNYIYRCVLTIRKSRTCCGLCKSCYLYVLSCRYLHTIRKSRTFCDLYKSWYVSVYSCRCLYTSENPEHVIYANHGIYLFYIVGVSILSGNPEHAVIYIMSWYFSVYSCRCLHTLRKFRTCYD